MLFDNICLSLMLLQSGYLVHFLFKSSKFAFNIFSIDEHDPHQVSLKIWWGFRSSFSISTYLLTSASVSALIYGIRGSSYLVGRFMKDSSQIVRIRYESMNRTGYSTTKCLSIFAFVCGSSSLNQGS